MGKITSLTIERSVFEFSVRQISGKLECKKSFLHTPKLCLFKIHVNICKYIKD